MDRYTSGGYAAENPSGHEEDAAHKADRVVGLVRALGLRPRRIVDVGCGTGAVLASVKAGLGDVDCEGWDVAPDAIARARAREAEGLRFIEGDFTTSDRRAELALCLDTFEHVADDVGFLAALGDRADWLVLRIPLDLSAWDVLRPHRLLEARRRWGHLHAYSRRLAFEVLEEAGLAVVAWRYDRVPPTLVGLRGRAVELARRALFQLSEDATVDVLGGWSLLVAARQRWSGQPQR